MTEKRRAGLPALALLVAVVGLWLAGCSAPGDQYIEATVKANGRSIEGFIVATKGEMLTIEIQPNMRVSYAESALTDVTKTDVTPLTAVRWRISTWWKRQRKETNEEGQIVIKPGG